MAINSQTVAALLVSYDEKDVGLLFHENTPAYSFITIRSRTVLFGLQQMWYWGTGIIQINKSTFLMDKYFVEIKSALWQKIFITLLVFPLEAFGIAAFFQRPLRVGEIAMLLCWFLGWFAPWWAVMRYSIRTDQTGISQTNGFFRQSIRWDDVVAYYVEPNRRYYGQSKQYVEPVMLDAQRKIIFQGFAPILVSTQKEIEHRREFWRFVEDQLQDKHHQEPPPDLHQLALKSLEINWAEKSFSWKIGRIAALVIYAVFWLCLGMGPVYYLVVNGITAPKYIGAFVAFIPFAGPGLHAVILIELRKRKIAEELKMNQR